MALRCRRVPAVPGDRARAVGFHWRLWRPRTIGCGVFFEVHQFQLRSALQI